MKKTKLDVNKNKKIMFRKREIENIVKFAIVFTSLVIVATFAAVFFTSLSENDFSELSLLMYDSTENSFLATNYPAVINTDKNETIFFMVKNYGSKVYYYEVRVIVTELSQIISLDFAVPTSECYNLYNQDTFEKILPSATKAEKEEANTIEADYIWGPTQISLYVNENIKQFLGENNQFKVVFELWSFDTTAGQFQYSGVVVFLELSYLQ